MFHQAIQNLVRECLKARDNGISLETIRHELLPRYIRPLLDSADDLLPWLREDKRYSYFYYEVQAQGTCAKPLEVAAAIVEVIVLTALEETLDT
jgi:hypothetical protein